MPTQEASVEVAELAVSAGAGLVGAVIGASSTLIAARRERRTVDRGELLESLTALLAALDALNLELRLLPRKTRVSRATDRILQGDLLPTLDFLLGWVYRKTLGRELERAAREFRLAGRRALLLAPDEILSRFEVMSELLAEDHEQEGWSQRWAEASEQLTAQARKAVQALSGR